VQCIAVQYKEVHYSTVWYGTVLYTPQELARMHSRRRSGEPLQPSEGQDSGAQGRQGLLTPGQSPHGGLSPSSGPPLCPAPHSPFTCCARPRTVGPRAPFAGAGAPCWCTGVACSCTREQYGSGNSVMMVFPDGTIFLFKLKRCFFFPPVSASRFVPFHPFGYATMASPSKADSNSCPTVRHLSEGHRQGLVLKGKPRLSRSHGCTPDLARR